MNLWLQARYTLARMILPNHYRQALDLGVDILNSLNNAIPIPASTLPHEIEAWLQQQDLGGDQ